MEGMALFRANNSNITALTASHNGGNGITVYLSRNMLQVFSKILAASMLLPKSYSVKFSYVFQLNVQISIWSSTETIIQNSSFVNINQPSYAGTINPSNLPAVITLFQSTLEIRECSFKQNHISAVRAHESNITLSGNVLFSNNTAVSGTDFILVQGSIISVVQNSNVIFENNYATNTGGVFYIGVNDYIYILTLFHIGSVF